MIIPKLTIWIEKRVIQRLTFNNIKERGSESFQITSKKERIKTFSSLV